MDSPKWKTHHMHKINMSSWWNAFGITYVRMKCEMWWAQTNSFIVVETKAISLLSWTLNNNNQTSFRLMDPTEIICLEIDMFALWLKFLKMNEDLE